MKRLRSFFHLDKQFVGQRRGLGFQNVKEVKQITCHLAIDLRFGEKASGFHVPIPGTISQIGRTDVGACATPPDDFGVVMLNQPTRKIGGSSFKKGFQNWNAYGHAIVEPSVESQRNPLLPAPIEKQRCGRRIGNRRPDLFRVLYGVLDDVPQITPVDTTHIKFHGEVSSDQLMIGSMVSLPIQIAMIYVNLKTVSLACFGIVSSLLSSIFERLYGDLF